MTELYDHIMNLAREAGAVQPQLGVGSDREPVVVDVDDGECYVIELRKMSDPGLPEQPPAAVSGINDTRALKEGWCVIDVNDGAFLEIQRRDEHSRFPTDVEADKHVRSRATEGSEYHLHVLRHVTAVNRQRATDNIGGFTGLIYKVLRSWDKEAVTTRRIIRVRADYRDSLGPYQYAVRESVGSNEDIVDLEESAAVPDITFENSGLKFAAMTVHVDKQDHDYPVACTCGDCNHTFPIDPCTEENLKTVLIDGRRVNVARCPECSALAHKPLARRGVRT